MKLWIPCAALVLFTLASADGGGAKKDPKKAAVAVVPGELFTFITEGDVITSLDIINKAPKTKLFDKVQSFEVDKATKFILVEGAKKTVFNAKNVLTDPKAKTGFQKENAVTVEHKGALLLSISFAPKKN